MSGPLAGLRVVAWTIWHQGPIAAALLGDLGAEVIKIEDRVAGDPCRGVAASAKAMLGVDAPRANWFFEAVNRNNKSVALDVTKQEGKQIVCRLVEKADIFLQNYRVGVAERMQLDYETLAQHNPKLIYVNSTGLGHKGPDRAIPVLDYVGLARSGIMMAAGEPGTGPQNVAGFIADRMGGIVTVYGVLAALVARERFGVGQQVDSSQLGGLVALQGAGIDACLALGQPFPRHDRARVRNPLYNHYRCSDDKWLVLSTPQADRFWPALCQAMNLRDLENDPKFAEMQVRAQHSEELIAILDRRFATKPREEWLRILRDEVDIPCGLVNSIEDLANDPQVLDNDYIIQYDDPRHGKIDALGFPVALSRTPLQVQQVAPEFGQHTEEVLIDLLGYTWEDIAELRSREVIL